MEEIVVDEDDLDGAEVDSDADEAAGDPSKAQGLVSMRDITKLVNRMNPHASTTNREKRKKKTFQMIKHKVRRKAKRSFREKQTALRDHLKKLAKQMRK
ncbi:unnamed protein product [Dibothriocephalus latus]|uniref:SDA1 C-terminal domain-containing protein n=1 Tax=Dibothriocephalus latus TaxID=60516 RepID=A0A3P7NMQ0_DIBLA|nr:unnamed protein product [Dibothriocephalus latus]